MKRNIKLLAVFNFFVDLDFFAPVAVIYFSQVTGSFALGMSIFSVIFLSSALFEIPTGIFSDLVGRKKTMISGTIANICAALLLATSTTYLALVISALFSGLARSFFSGNNDAFLYDTLKESGQEHTFKDVLGKLASMFQIALAIAALTGSILASWSFSIVLWLLVITNVVTFFISLFLKEPKIHSEKSGNIFLHLGEALKVFRTSQKLRLISITSIIKFSLGEAGYKFRSIFVSTLWPLWAIGLSNMISNIGAATGYYFSGKLIKRFSTEKILKAEIIVNRIVNLTALLIPTPLSPALMGLTSIGYGAGSVATDSLLQKEFTDKQRATLGSLNSLGGSIAFATVSIGLGVIGDRIGPRFTLILLHILFFSPLLFYKKIFKSRSIL